jgi:arylsulfatase A-like enzyme
MVLGPREEERRLSLPPSVQLEGRNLLQLSIPGWKKRVADASKRRRSYLALKGLDIRPLTSGGPASLPRREEGGLRLPPASSASFYLREEAPFSVEMEAEVALGISRLELSLDRGDSWVSLARLPLRPGVRPRATADATPPPDGFCRLQIANAGPAEAVLRSLLLRSAAERPRSAPIAVREAFLRRPRPNIVIFLADTLRADHLGLYGHPRDTSPRLDAFAREAISFEEAWSVSSWTAPSVASLFTGLGPEAHAVSGLDVRLVDRAETLAERLRGVGYRSAAFVANGLVESSRGFAQGFDTWNGKRESSLYGARPKVVVAQARRWLDSAREPFFLYVHSLDPHGPYEPTPEHRQLFAGLADKIPPRVAYEGEVHEADAAFGALVDDLRARGLLDRTLVGFTADHGEEFADHGGTGHGHSLYPELIRVPLVLRLPGGALGGQRVATPVQQPDLVPTFLTAAGATTPDGVEARPLWEAWPSPETTAPRGRTLFGSTRLGGPDGWDKAYVRDGHLKLIVNLEARTGPGSRLQLFDLGNDPENRANQAPVRSLAARYLREQMQTIEGAQAVIRERLRAGEKVELTPEQEERLRALGYLGG